MKKSTLSILVAYLAVATLAPKANSLTQTGFDEVYDFLFQFFKGNKEMPAAVRLGKSLSSALMKLKMTFLLQLFMTVWVDVMDASMWTTLTMGVWRPLLPHWKRSVTSRAGQTLTLDWVMPTSGPLQALLQSTEVLQRLDGRMKSKCEKTWKTLWW